MKKFLLIILLASFSSQIIFGAGTEEYTRQLFAFNDALSKTPPAYEQAERALNQIKNWWTNDSKKRLLPKQQIAKALGAPENNNPDEFVNNFLKNNFQLVADMRAGKVTQPQPPAKNPPPPPPPPAGKGGTPPAGEKSGEKPGANFPYYKQILTSLRSEAAENMNHSKWHEAATILESANNKLKEAEALVNTLTSEQKKELILLVLEPLQSLRALAEKEVRQDMLTNLQTTLAELEKKPASPPPPPPPPAPPAAPTFPPLKQPTNLAGYEEALKTLQKRMKDLIEQNNVEEAQKQLTQAHTFLDQALKIPLVEPARKKTLIDLILEPASILNGLDAAKFGEVFKQIQQKKNLVDEEEKSLKTAAEEKEKKDEEERKRESAAELLRLTQERQAEQEMRERKAAQEAQQRANEQKRKEEEELAKDEAALTRVSRGLGTAAEVLRVASIAQRYKEELKNAQAERAELAAMKEAQKSAIGGLSEPEEAEIRQLGKYFNPEKYKPEEEFATLPLQPGTPISVQKEMFEKMENLYRTAKRQAAIAVEGSKAYALKSEKIAKDELLKIKETARRALGDLKTKLDTLQSINNLAGLKDQLKTISSAINR